MVEDDAVVALGEGVVGDDGVVVVDGDECVLVVGAAVGDGEMADVDISCV